MSATLDKAVETLKRSMLKDLLDRCTAPQRELFHRIYLNGVPTEKLDAAFDLCERTVHKNERVSVSS